MKISKVKWRNHPILGDLEINFSNPANDEPFDNIILAGENGTGKTTILETISSFLNSGSFEFFEFIEYHIDNKLLRATPQTDGNIIKSFYDIFENGKLLSEIRSDKSNNPQLIESNNLDIRHYGCVLSKARADFKTKKITATTTKSLDESKYDLDSEDDFTSLKQLIVDVYHKDNNNYASINQQFGDTPMPWEKFNKSSKISRFSNAFNSFFDKLKYHMVTDWDSEKAILFRKNGNTINIDSLSTGEKQIVFRGIYLLKNNKNLHGASIMIDEPELSMHPKWQKNILKYYQDLFSELNNQKAQLFIATHSEHVVSEGLKDRCKNLVIVLNESEGIISSEQIIAPSVLPSITSAETNYLAFDIASIDYHIELYGWLQEKEKKSSVKSCDRFIINHPNYEILKHQKKSSFHTTTYESLCTYIRNAIHHPISGKTFTEDELKTSIELLIQLCK